MRTVIYHNTLASNLQGGVGTGIYFSTIAHNEGPHTVPPDSLCWGQTEYKYQQPFPISGRLLDMRVQMSGSPGAGESFTFTIRKNGSDAGGLSVTISGTNDYGEDLINNVSVEAGDLMGFMCVPSSGATNRSAKITIIFESEVQNVSLILGGNDILVSSINGNEANTLISGSGFDSNVLEDFNTQIFPTSGYLRNFYMHFSDQRNGANSDTCTVYVNSASTALSLVMGPTDTDKSNTTDVVYVNAGDNGLMYIRWPTGSPAPIGTAPSWGIEFDPDFDGESIFACVNSGNPSSTLEQHNSISKYAASSEWGTYSSNKRMVAENMLFGNLFVQTNVAPGSGKSRTVALAVNGTATALSVTLSESSTGGFNITDVVQVNSGDFLTYITTPTSTPTAPDRIRISMVSFSLGVSSFLKPMRFWSRTPEIPFIFYDLSSGDPMIFSSRT